MMALGLGLGLPFVTPSGRGGFLLDDLDDLSILLDDLGDSSPLVDDLDR